MDELRTLSCARRRSKGGDLSACGRAQWFAQIMPRLQKRVRCPSYDGLHGCCDHKNEHDALRTGHYIHYTAEGDVVREPREHGYNARVTQRIIAAAQGR
jgi:hypothetical protein